VLYFPSPAREKMPLSKRVMELSKWSKKIKEEEGCENLRKLFKDKALKDHSYMLAQTLMLEKQNKEFIDLFIKVKNTRLWKLRQFIKNFF